MKVSRLLVPVLALLLWQGHSFAETIVFDQVNVLPMTSEVVLENQRVIVKDGIIEGVGPADQIAIPANADIISAKEKYLMPGLADMHAHLDLNGKPDSLWHYLAYGVTTIRNLNGIPQHFQWRDQVNQGKLEGPTIYTSGHAIVGLPAEYGWVPYAATIGMTLGPVLAIIAIGLFIRLMARYSSLFSTVAKQRKLFWGFASLSGVVGLVIALNTSMTTLFHIFVTPLVSVPESVEDARQFVRDQYAAQADFIKPYNYMPKEHYFAVVSEAKKLGLYVAGHTTATPEPVSIQEWISAGQNEVVHADELTHYFWKGYDPKVNAWVEYGIDMSRIDEVAKLLAKNNIALTPTLITNDITLRGLENLDGLFAQPEYRWMHEDLINGWRSRGRFVNWKGQEKYRRDIWRPFLMNMTKALSDHGGLINTGADVTVEGVVPGHTIHQELQVLVEAGLTPFQALSAGTRNPGITVKRMGRNGNFGTVEPGQRADLILLNSNPLVDISNTLDRVGVMARGKWYTQEKLDQQIANHLLRFK